ncbi:MAG: DUF3089 domain-containing protein [Oscillospiraceae bacterium]|nr:DUF3089 domain-containing protein [Oscillospiraceae bacterium]
MKMCKSFLVFLLIAALALPAAVLAAPAASGVPDYADRGNWAYFADGEDKDVDVFLICPLVDTKSETNALVINERLKGKFLNALDMEKGIYSDVGRMYSPFYRQMSLNAYRLSETERTKPLELAYGDISAAFRWYLDNENNGRGLILAGFSQGGEMCLELLKEYYGGESAEAVSLRNNLIAVYAIGWSFTAETAEAYPQIVAAKGETDTGTVISFDCEDGSLSGTLVNPAGKKALSINPLNWKTDGTVADRSRNLGAVMSTGAQPIPALCGAYLGSRGELVVTDVTADEYPPGIDIFAEGSFHIYDYQFFFENLRENVATRTTAWKTGLPFKDVPAGTWYTDAVASAWKRELMVGTGEVTFSPLRPLRRSQLTTILWRIAGEPAAGGMPFSDVGAEQWYAEAASWAASSAITEQTSGRFGADEEMTREEAALLLWNFAKAVGADVSVGEDINLLSYNDFRDISEARIPAMQWAVGSGVIEGTGVGMLSPGSRLNRAQAAVMLERLSRILGA